MYWQHLGSNLPRKGNRCSMMLGRSVFRLMGWRIEGEFPDRAKMIVAVAPHSSNVDFVLAMAVVLGLGLRASFLAKRSLFNGPLSRLMYAFGGVPVDRDASQGLVGQLVREFAERTHLVLGITPEGTRRHVQEWKRGFALIAQAAEVPVLPATINYRSKIVRFEPLITDVSDVEQTMSVVKRAANDAGRR